MRRIPKLDGLRALAILMVFATHALGVPLLWIGVDLFFVISGYLITGILLRLKERRAGYFIPFYLRRARRILPPYLMFLLIATLIFHLQWIVWLWCGLFSANVGLALGRLHQSVLTPLWSLAVEEQFYLVWPLVVLLCPLQALRRVTLIVVLFSPLLRALATPLFSTHFPIYFLTPFRADSLCAGAFLAVSEQLDSNWPPSHRPLARNITVISALCFVLLSTMPSFRTGSNSMLFNSIGYSLIAIFFSAILALALTTPSRLTFLSWQPLRYLGRISYAFYLWHWTVLNMLSGSHHSRFEIAALAFSATLAISAASWHLVERPILSLPSTVIPEPRSAAALAA